MNLDTKKFFVSRDVVFHENTFPFANLSHSSSIFPSPTTVDSYSIPIDDVGTYYILLTPIVHPTPSILLPQQRSSRVPTPPVWSTYYSCPTLSHSNLATSLYPLSKFFDYSHFSHPYQSFWPIFILIGSLVLIMKPS